MRSQISAQAFNPIFKFPINNFAYKYAKGKCFHELRTHLYHILKLIQSKQSNPHQFVQISRAELEQITPHKVDFLMSTLYTLLQFNQFNEPEKGVFSLRIKPDLILPHGKKGKGGQRG